MGLQELIDAAAPGAVVRIPAGRHPGGLVLHQAVTLLGEEGLSVIDAGRSGSALLLDVPTGAQVKLHGLVLENGVAPAGGGVLIRSGVVLMQRCAIRGCAAPGYGGGGIYASGQELTLEACELSNCEGRQGGGLLLDLDVTARLSCCLISRNRARLGGGLRLKEGAHALLEGCTIADNGAPGGEGPQLYLSGTMSRTPRLELYNSILAGDGPAIVNAQYAGTVEGSHLLVPEEEAAAGIASVLRGEPGFRGGVNGPYGLTAGSKAIGAGAPARKSVPRDLLGAERERGGRMDLGAYSQLG